jgi:hypothetical protein
VILEVISSKLWKRQIAAMYGGEMLVEHCKSMKIIGAAYRLERILLRVLLTKVAGLEWRIDLLDIHYS